MLIDSNTIALIKANWQLILGADKCGKGAICPLCGSGSGKHGTGLSLIPDSDYTLKCFGCGESGDVLSFICKKNGWDVKTDFVKAAKFCADIAGISIDNSYTPRGVVVKKSHERNKSSITLRNITQQHNLHLSTDIDRWQKNFDNTVCKDYLLSRGFIESDFVTLKLFRVGLNIDKPTQPYLSIPFDHSFYCLRAIFNVTQSKDRFRYPRGAKRVLFNRNVIGRDNIFALTEGAIDALSLICCGIPAVAMPAKSLSPLITINPDKMMLTKSFLHFNLSALLPCLYYLPMIMILMTSSNAIARLYKHFSPTK